MKLIIALGNPGKEYAHTRHNAGWLAIDILAQDLSASWSEEKKLHAWTAKGKIGNETVILAKPNTFMNLSGEAVKSLLSYYKDIAPTDIVIVQDELDLEPGQMKFSEKAGPGGHNGIKSIFEVTQKTDFPRLRIGVGRPSQAGVPVDGWVLGRIEDESQTIAEKKAVDALKTWATDGLAKAMNQWNG